MSYKSTKCISISSVERACAEPNRFGPSVWVGITAGHYIHQTFAYSRAHSSPINVRKHQLSVFVGQALDVRYSRGRSRPETLCERPAAVGRKQFIYRNFSFFDFQLHLAQESK